MYIIRKIFRVPVGHRLSKHRGLCKNLHGHNFKIEVQLKSNLLDDNDMVMDFKDIKEIVNSVLDDFDHCTILNSSDLKFIDFCEDNNLKYSVIGIGNQDPTAEVFCKELYLKISDLVNRKVGLEEVIVDFVRIWENDNSMAEYRE